MAVPSQKAALKAWGTDANLFARGLAEEINEPKLTREPLSRPGEVVRVKRGIDAEHFRALPKRNVSTAPNSKAETTISAVSRPGERETRKPAKPAPSKPSRDVLDRAEMALADAEPKYKAAMQALAAKRER